MARPVTLLVVFFITFNLFAGMLTATGTDAMLGLDAEVGGDKAVGDAAQRSENVSTGTSLGNTLFGMYNVLANGLSSVFDVIFPGLAMLRAAGVPAWIAGGQGTVGFLPPLFTVIMFIGFVSFLRGWDL